jgi:arylsulfatase
MGMVPSFSRSYKGNKIGRGYPMSIPGRVRTLLLCLLCMFLFGFSGTPSGTNIVLISVDALRADHLGCYGYSRDTSPFLDKLAEEGILFSNAIVQWPKTQPSMASMLTGAYPWQEAIDTTASYGLPRSLTLMSERLKKEDFSTLAVVSNYNLGKNFGFNKGFDVFIESWMDEFTRKKGKQIFRNRPGLVKEFTNATLVTNQALNLLETYSSEEKFFMWIHYMDTHGPYIPPKSYQNFFADWTPGEAIPVDDIPQYQRQSKPDSQEIIVDPEYYRAQYDREIRYWDNELKRLISFMKKKGIYNRTIIVITADHGESLGENNYFFEHGKLPYQPCSHVPLIILAPNLRDSSKHIIEEPVGLIDLMPTLLDMLGIAKTADLEGETLLPFLLSGTGPTERAVFTRAGYNSPYLKAIRLGDWKLIHVGSAADRDLMKGQEYELYNISDDPMETKNLADAFPEKVSQLKEAMTRSAARDDDDVQSETAQEKLKHDEFSREMLKALGYIQ